MKLNLQDKLKIIELYKNGYTIPKLCMKFNVKSTTIERIERQYREHGISCFKDKGKNNQYTVEFKYEIVNRVLNGESISSITTELCINEGLIFLWVKKYKELGYNGLIIKRKGRPKLMNPNNKKAKKTNETPEIVDDKDNRIKELEERNAQLEMENDLLKKLRALVQQRQQQQSKKK